MERFIPDDIINEIRSRCDIVDIIQGYIPLKRSAGRFKALCPFHGEKTPSFFVNQDRQTYHCFGCQKGGDVFRFIMEKEGVIFLMPPISSLQSAGSISRKGSMARGRGNLQTRPAASARGSTRFMRSLRPGIQSFSSNSHHHVSPNMSGTAA